MTRHSIIGYFIMLGDSPVSWRTKKQTIVAGSSAEAEYKSMAHTTCEILWSLSLLKSLWVLHERSIDLYCDSQAALHIVANPIYLERTKHINVDCHFIREHIQPRKIQTSYISMKKQPANIFTKGLGRYQFQYLLGKLGVHNLHTPT